MVSSVWEGLTSKSVYVKATDILKQREIEDSSTCSRRLIFPDWWPYVVILVTQFILLQVVALVQIMVLPLMFWALQIPYWISIIESKQQTRDVRQRNYIKCYGFILNGFQTFVNPFILNGLSSINSKSPSVLISLPVIAGSDIALVIGSNQV